VSETPPTTSDVGRAPKAGRAAWQFGCAVVGAIGVGAVVLFLAFWWLVQPAGLLHDTFAPR
jgi:hypothetical protein